MKNPVKCLDGKEKTDYDWLALKDTTGVQLRRRGFRLRSPSPIGRRAPRDACLTDLQRRGHELGFRYNRRAVTLRGSPRH